MRNIDLEKDNVKNTNDMKKVDSELDELTSVQDRMISASEEIT